jgi:hypothetical protein
MTPPSGIAFFKVAIIVDKYKDSVSVSLFCKERTDIVQRRHFRMGNAFSAAAEPGKLLMQ